MSVLISRTQSTCCIIMPLGLGMVFYGVIQLVESFLIYIFHWTSQSSILRIGYRVMAVISFVDGFTGILSGFSRLPSLALAASIGFAIDCVTHATLVFLRHIASVQESGGHFKTLIAERGTSSTIPVLSVLLIFTAYFVRTGLTYYQFGGTGWEKLSPGDFMDAQLSVGDIDELLRDQTMREQEEQQEADSEFYELSTKVDPVYI